MSLFNFSKKQEVAKHAKKTDGIRVKEGKKHIKIQCENWDETTTISRGTGSIAPGAKNRINKFFNTHPDNCDEGGKTG